MIPAFPVDSLATAGDRRILLVVIDGLGGVPREAKTELEAAWIPNLDRLAARSSLGMMVPIGYGITPGSGPAHLSLFGYDPFEYRVGRGVLEAMGIGLQLEDGDLCARANFATLDEHGRVADRRAGRISTEECTRLSARLQEAIPRIGDVEVIVRPGREHRFVVVFRGPDLGEGLSESDPQGVGVPPLEVVESEPGGKRAADVVNTFAARCRDVLASESPANFVLLRGIARRPDMPTMGERFKLDPACVAVYPMYRGLARLVGMTVLETGDTWDEEVGVVRQHRHDHDFFYLHIKQTDKAGEDGDFDAKVELIERFDEIALPQILELGFDVLCITGDHSTPAVLQGHSWHSVPLLIHSLYVRPQLMIEEFGERACARGNLGFMHGTQVMPMLLAHALRLRKYGA